MDINTRSRTELKTYFVKNAIPTESNFAELIDGMFNQQDDGLVKARDNPLSIEAAGDSSIEQPVIHFYSNFSSANPDWVLNLNPRSDPSDPNSGKPGLNISDGQGNSRLFIDHDTGNIGIGTTNPGERLHINGNIRGNQEGAVRISTDHGWVDVGPRNISYSHFYTDRPRYYFNKGIIVDSGRFGSYSGNLSLITGTATRVTVLGSNGNVGVGTTSPGEKLEVTGVVRAVDGLQINGNRSTHLDNDGAIYRYGGQVYITVDDNLYIRDSGGSIQFHFDTNRGIIRQEGWISPTFENGWVNYGGSHNTAGYFKDSQGIVHLKGLVKKGVIGRAIFTLPAGYRPAGQELQVVSTYSDTVGRVDILTNGGVRATSGSNRWFSLDGVTFRAA